MADNIYLEKAAAILQSPVYKADRLGSVVRSAKDFMGKRTMGLKSQAKTPMITRIKDSFH